MNDHDHAANHAPLPEEMHVFVEQAKAQGMDVFTIDENSGEYDNKRQVQNLRFERFPAIIVMCKSAAHVRFWFECANDNAVFKDFKFVVRSGGHQHQARSTNDGAIVLDLSLISGAKVSDDKETAWIGTGTPIKQMNAELKAQTEADPKIIPVGLCDSVNVGGLTHGGGWGFSWRTDGMTIDKLVDVEIVTGNGEEILSAKETHPKLLEAVRGGGGGNFGVVTRLQFELTPQASENFAFSYFWKDPAHRVAVAKEWVNLMRTGDHRLNSFCRLSPKERTGQKKEYSAFAMAGVFYGPRNECLEELAPIIERYPPNWQGMLAADDFHDLYALFTNQPRGAEVLAEAEVGGSTHDFALLVGPPGEGGPASTCTGAHRHQVTSSFPDNSDKMLQDIHDFLCGAEDVEGANLYVSLHGMGGAGATEAKPSSYPWRNEPFLIQGQAWWKGSHNDEACMKFITGLREQMKKRTKGAFLSFPDEALPKGLYYGHMFDSLFELKKLHDSNDWLSYPLGLTWPELKPSS